jgi:hypothetical protein
MHKLIAGALAVFALTAAAEGPGSRIRTTPEVPQTMGFVPADVPRTEARRCDGLQGERLAQCRADSRREADAERKSSGPEATGMGSGAGAGPTSGTAGGASFGGSAPR